jgi:hypothetical protein
LLDNIFEPCWHCPRHNAAGARIHTSGFPDALNSGHNKSLDSWLPGGFRLSNAAAGGIDRKHHAESVVRRIWKSFKIRYLMIAGTLQAGYS